MTTTETLLTVLQAAGRAHVTPLLKGDPGTAKSSLVAALAAAENVAFECVVGSGKEPADFNGLPVVNDDGVSMHPPAWAKRLAAAGSGYLLLDELSTAAGAVQAAMLGVVLDRRVGDLLLPRDVRILAAMNPPERAADGWDLTPPMANRLLHIDYEPEVEAWLDGMTAGFSVPAARAVAHPSPARTAIARASVASFIRTRPALLHAYPSNDAATGAAWPSRRTWTMTADVLALLDPQDTDAAEVVACGLVGEGAATEYLTWRRTADLPDPADVLADPDSVPWTQLDPSRTWAVLAGVVGYCTGRGTVEAWRDAWGPLATAAEHGRGDVAAACARTLLTARPASAKIPRAAKAFSGVLADAGLLAGAA